MRVRTVLTHADPRDEHRNGFRWEDIDLERRIADVFGKTRERQPIPLTDRVIDALERYRAVLDPAGEDWPVFPMRHHSLIADAAEDGLEAKIAEQDPPREQTFFDSSTAR